ncbi:MAG: DNA mismatch repair protein MutS [Candidatus Eremiobacteraeota bacterium]|nr:DNA mismatch repair protein MutS [Candidatus Eremiobacteraeota bacterium]
MPADGSISSPLIAQYLELKSQYPEALLLSRVGDFYEAYGDDAEDLAASVRIVLTSKEAGKGKRVAMAGVPHHNLDHYLGRLIKQQRVIAIAEQMEPPAPNRLVRREIVRVITPGTVLEDHLLTADRNNYLAVLAASGGHNAIACADVSTGETSVAIVDGDDELAAELDRTAPAEVIVESDEDILRLRALAGDACRIAAFDSDALDEKGGEAAPQAAGAQPAAVLARFSADERSAARAALLLLAHYLRYLRLDGAAVASRAHAHSTRSAMLIDPATRRHLDLLSGSGENSRASLLSVLARTKTSMGGRMLARWLCAPLVDAQAIASRHDRVEALVAAPSWRAALQTCLAQIGDIERIVQKVNSRRAGPRDLAALRDSLHASQHLHAVVEEGTDEELVRLAAPSADADAVLALLQEVLAEEPPALLSEGGAIRPQYNADLHALIEMRTRSRDHLLALEERTRARTGIKSLKVKYTQAFGYYYEVTRANAGALPPEFIRRQTLVNAERFTDSELRALEAEIVSARSRQIALEKELFESLLVQIDAQRERLLSLAERVARLDVYVSLAQAAGERGYVRPHMLPNSEIDVSGARHPIVEAYGGVDFVPNDCRLDQARRFLLITGPNMGGKSTYLRQTALLSIMAQMGSFVPAARARMGIVERLFTRIGAGDDIAAGRSTFYVEMAEMALVLRGCTPASLLLIDEVGRGTGTTDGLAIAQAISEYLLGAEGAMPMVLFATHFHELVRLSERFPAVENLHVAVADEVGGPIFSHRLLRGSSSRSYGIAVAKMAGLPPEVVQRAQEIADDIERRPGPSPAPVRRRGSSHPDAQLALDVDTVE